MQGIYNNIIYLKQTMVLGYVVLQLLCSYSSVVVVVIVVVSIHYYSKNFQIVWHILSIECYCFLHETKV